MQICEVNAMNIVIEKFGIRGAKMRDSKTKYMVMTFLFLMMVALPWQADAGTAGKVYNLSLDIGTLDDRPLYYITSFPTTFKVRAKVIDQLGAPVTGLTSTQLVIQSGKNATSGIAWTQGTDYSIGTFTELGNGLYDWTATLNASALASNTFGQFEVRITGAPATDNQWLASTVHVKNGVPASDDIKYIEVSPRLNNSYGFGDYGVIFTGTPDFPFNVRFFGPAGAGAYPGEVQNSSTPTGVLQLGLLNWTANTGSNPIYYPRYLVSGYHNYSGGFDYYFFLKGGSTNIDLIYINAGELQYITVSVKKGNTEFLVPMGLTTVSNYMTTRNSYLPVPTYSNPALFPFTTVSNYHNSTQVTVQPGGATTLVGMFTPYTNTGTDTLNSVTLDLSTGGAAVVGRIDITDQTGTIVYGSLTNPSSDAAVVPFTPPLTVTTSGYYYTRITPKSHADMPLPQGGSYLISANVIAIDHTTANPVTIVPGSGGTPFVTIDNFSPANPVWSSIVPSGSQMSLSWANPADTDFSQVVILRDAATVADIPAEGATYAAGNTIGTSTVACVVNKPATSCTDSGLVGGTGYYYRIFAKDTNSNYSAVGSASGPHISGNQTTPGTCVASTAGPTSLVVTMPYTNDVNATNTYTVEYKQSTATTWSSWTAAAHVASPYITTITGLPLVNRYVENCWFDDVMTFTTICSSTFVANSYDVRCTYNDSDAVEAVNPQTITGVILPDYRTTPGAATAVAARATSIAVTMPYGDDSNGNSQYSVEYKLISDVTWSSWVNAAAHKTSPYSTTITGLTQAESYDVRVTYLDSDGINGNSQKVISGIIQPDNRIQAGYANAMPIGSTSIQVAAPYSNDANGNGAVIVEYQKSQEFSNYWIRMLSGEPNPANSYKATLNGLDPETAYDVRVTYSDPDGVTGGMEEQIFYRINTFASRLMHNSVNANKNGYWSQFGGWGVKFGQYGEFTCLTCHTKRTSNASGIRNYINLNPLPGSTNYGGSVRYDGPTGGPFSMGDDTMPRTEPYMQPNRICEVCHTLTSTTTSLWNGTTWVRSSGPTPSHTKIRSTLGNHAPFNTIDCTSCHKHDNGFSTNRP